jgi:tetratricopeptide (TPR) repeat protein
LQRAAEINGNDVNIRVALAVALGRMGRIDEAVDVLNAAVAQDGNNPWARRNLAALLVQSERIDEAIPHYEAATRLLPGDQIAWQGLADAYRLAGRTKEAEDAYVRAVQIDPHSDIAEKACSGSNLLAESGFVQARQVMPKDEAVQYCLDAMKLFAKMSATDLQKLTLDLAMAGRDGFAVHDPNRRYRCKGLKGEFSGLAMVCHLYVAMQRMAPGTDIGFDLEAEYQQAKRAFERNRNEG